MRSQKKVRVMGRYVLIPRFPAYSPLCCPQTGLLTFCCHNCQYYYQINLAYTCSPTFTLNFDTHQLLAVACFSCSEMSRRDVIIFQFRQIWNKSGPTFIANKSRAEPVGRVNGNISLSPVEGDQCCEEIYFTNTRAKQFYCCTWKYPKLQEK